MGVLFFHANATLRGGYLGVDLFFVLSGFLITSLLLAEHRETGRIALWAFWARRARRLLPALLSLMPAVAIYGRFFAKPDELRGLRADALATLGYVANWRAILSHKSYWELFAAPSPLEHTWSLSIEEQFYVVWPLLTILVLYRGNRRAFLVLILLLAALSMSAMFALTLGEGTSRAYLGTDTRAAGILAGAALATVMSPDTTFQAGTLRKLDALGVVAAVGLAVAWWKLDGEDPFLYRGGFWLTEIAALVLIACSLAGRFTVVGRLLSLRPLALVGTISYGLYLWHWPVNVLLTPERVHLHGAWLHVLQFALTFAIAIVSYRVLELPIRTRRLPLRPTYALSAAIALSVLLVFRATNARALPEALPPLPTTSDGAADSGPPDPPLVTFRVMLLGDSTANSLGWGLRGVQRPGVAVDLRGFDSCTMLWDTCGGASWKQEVHDLRPDATLVFLGGAFLHGLEADGRFRRACHRAWDGKFEKTLALRLGGLGSPAGRVWAVTVPYPLGPYDSAPFRAEVDCINVSIRRAVASVPGIEILDLASQLCPHGVCKRKLDDVIIRSDGVHYSIEGARELSRWVFEEIQR